MQVPLLAAVNDLSNGLNYTLWLKGGLGYRMVEKRENGQELILDASVKLFERFGYRNVKISDITSELGMTTGYFYYHFRSKEQILQLIYESYITIAADTVRVIANKKGVNATEKLKELINIHCVRIRDYHAQVSVFFREYRNLPESSIIEIKKQNAKYLKNVISIIEQGVKEGHFRQNINVKLFSLAMIGMCNWIYQWYEEGRERTIEEVADSFYDLIANGLLTEEHSQA
jgi:TetR/AcrR family transcriptional regulator, cholesterol catabolism regulator